MEETQEKIKHTNSRYLTMRCRGLISLVHDFHPIRWCIKTSSWNWLSQAKTKIFNAGKKSCPSSQDCIAIVHNKRDNYWNRKQNCQQFEDWPTSEINILWYYVFSRLLGNRSLWSRSANCLWINNHLKEPESNRVEANWMFLCPGRKFYRTTFLVTM